jgi:hypothetical protein
MFKPFSDVKMSSSGNIIKCEKCGKTLIAEQSSLHRCKEAIEMKEIPIEYYFEMKSEEGNPAIYARSLTGVIYWLEVIPKRTRKRKRALIVPVLLIMIIMSHSLVQVAASPTEISQPTTPTIKVTLPYVR